MLHLSCSYIIQLISVTLKGFNFAGTYFINIEPYSSSGNFNLTIIRTELLAGATTSNAIPIISGYTGQLPGPGPLNETWLTVQLDGNFSFTLQLLGSTSSKINFYLYDSSLNLLKTSLNVDMTSQTISVNGLSGKYYIKLNYAYHLFDWIPDSYSLTISSITEIAGSSSSSPILISTGSTNGNMPGPGSNGNIWYSINLQGDYEISLTASDNTDFDLFVYDSNLNLVDSSALSSYPEKIDLTNLQGTYLIEIKDTLGQGSYTLTITEISTTNSVPTTTTTSTQTSHNTLSSSNAPFSFVSSLLTIFILFPIISWRRKLKND